MNTAVVKCTVHFNALIGLRDKISRNISDEGSAGNGSDSYGFVVGKLDKDTVEIADFVIYAGTGKEDYDFDEFADIFMIMAVVEDRLYSEFPDRYILGLFRIHRGFGTVPSPGDITDFASVASVNPSAILVIFDPSISESYNKHGFGVYILEDPALPEESLREIPIEFPDSKPEWPFGSVSEDTSPLSSVSSSGGSNIVYVESLIEKAKASIQIDHMNDARGYLTEAEKIAVERNDPELIYTIRLLMAEIFYREKDYRSALRLLKELKESVHVGRFPGIFGDIMCMLGRILVKLGKRKEALRSFIEAEKYYGNAADYIKSAYTLNLMGLLRVVENTEEGLRILLKALGSLSHIRSDERKQYIINRLGLERNARSLIKSLKNEEDRKRYLEILNEISETYGYKFVLDDI